jgi:hypothetical protein
MQQWLPFAAASASPSGRLLRNDQRSVGGYVHVPGSRRLCVPRHLRLEPKQFLA